MLLDFDEPKYTFRDELLLHPDDFAKVPPRIVALLKAQGIEVRSYLFLQRGTLLATGTAASIVRSLQFHRDVQNAMKENHAFLELMKRNGLLD